MSILNPKMNKRYHFSAYAPFLISVTILLSLFIRFIFYTEANLIAEETYYWNYAQHLDFGYLDHPPMVALLIYISTKLFGLHELTVRLPAFLSWIGTAYFTYKLTELMSKGSGVYTVLLLSIMPCFFIQSLVISPDQPLIFCWAASLYYLHCALIEEDKSAWYKVGLWFGLGMLSKYTMGLLIPATVIYMLMTRPARAYFLKKEPYIAALISLIIFSPVIYWNIKHAWVSFAFQSVNRFSDDFYFYLPYFLLFILIFTTHLGAYGLLQFFKQRNNRDLKKADFRFILVFSLMPLAFLGYESVGHVIKMNWIAPTLIALLPWFAHLIKKANRTYFVNYQNSWIVTGMCLLLTYSVFLSYLLNDFPDLHIKKLLVNNLSWRNLAFEINKIADKTEKQYQTPPIIVGLDRYYINSELSFYQSLLSHQHIVSKPYPMIGRHIFNRTSLMYQYWYPNPLPDESILMLVATGPKYFEIPMIKNNTTILTDIQTIQALTQRKDKVIQKFYYQIVKTHSALNEKVKLS